MRGSNASATFEAMTNIICSITNFNYSTTDIIQYFQIVSRNLASHFAQHEDLNESLTDPKQTVAQHEDLNEIHTDPKLTLAKHEEMNDHPADPKVS